MIQRRGPGGWPAVDQDENAVECNGFQGGVVGGGGRRKSVWARNADRLVTLE